MRPYAIDLGGESRTKQSFQNESDVNTIMGKWRKSGHIEHLNKAKPRYGDFTNADDYIEAQAKLIDANEAFMALPSIVRKRFENSPAELLAFMADSANNEEAVALGLATRAEKPTPPAPAAPTPPLPEEPSPIEGGE